jgi:hypothetical protein
MGFVDFHDFRSLRVFSGIYIPAMNGQSNRAVNLVVTGNFTMTGTLTIAYSELESFIARARGTAPSATPVVVAHEPLAVQDEGGLPRMAFTMKETAEILGVSYITVHRLIQRGLLRSSKALRCKIVSKKEIERFLNDTSKSVY